MNYSGQDEVTTQRSKEVKKKALGPPSPPFFGTAHSKGVTASLSVSAESKGLICTKMVQNLGVLGTAHSKGLTLLSRSEAEG